MTFPGAPSIYYGSEVGMLGGKDPDCRRAFNWDESSWNHDLRDYFKQCIALRKRYRALRDGEFQVLFAAGDVVAYLRTWGEEKLIVVLNCGAATTVEIPVCDLATGGMRAITVLGRPAEYITSAGYLRGVAIPERTGVVLHLSPAQ
jgi:glycosidase